MINITKKDERAVIEELGEVKGRIYISWFKANVERITKEWFKYQAFTIEDMEKNMEHISERFAKEFTEWYEGI